MTTTYTKEMAQVIVDSASTERSKIAKLRAKAKRLEVALRDAQLDAMEAEARHLQMLSDAERSLGHTTMADAWADERESVMQKMRAL